MTAYRYHEAKLWAQFPPNRIVTQFEPKPATLGILRVEFCCNEFAAKLERLELLDLYNHPCWWDSFFGHYTQRVSPRCPKSFFLSRWQCHQFSFSSLISNKPKVSMLYSCYKKKCILKSWTIKITFITDSYYWWWCSRTYFCCDHPLSLAVWYSESNIHS